MKKNLFVLLLTTFTAGSMLAGEDSGGFLAHLGRGVGEIVESPAHIGQGGKKRNRDEKSQSEMKRSKREREETSSRTTKSRRSRRRSNEDSMSNRE